MNRVVNFTFEGQKSGWQKTQAKRIWLDAQKMGESSPDSSQALVIKPWGSSEEAVK